MIKCRQLGLGAAAANQHHDIEIVVTRQCAQRARHHVDRPLALHSHIDDPEAERQTASIEFVGEVTPRRAGRAGDHADT